MLKENNCKFCNNPFQPTISIQKFCSSKCRRKYYKIRYYPKLPNCSVIKCYNKATRKGKLCEKHYYRIRRTGKTDEMLHKDKYIDKRGYVVIPKFKYKSHPIEMSNGLLYEHRQVCYDKYGSEEQKCFWCGLKLNWKDIVIDHLDENKTNNSEDNLVIACYTCNILRGSMIALIDRIKKDNIDLFIELIKKYKIKSCEECHKKEHLNDKEFKLK